MHPLEVFGWAAAALTMLTHSQRTMLPLRLSAISASGCFIVWSVHMGLYPTLILHTILLPLNIYRLSEIIIMKRRAKAAREEGSFSLDWIRPLLRSEIFECGSYVFRKGDKPDKLYYLVSGAVAFDEVGKHAGPGDLFGELAFFTRQRERTASARCIVECEILTMDHADFTRLFLQDPAFNLHVVRTIAERLVNDPVPVDKGWPPFSRAAE